MSAVQTTTTTQTTTQKGNTLETTTAIKMPPFKVVTNGDRPNGRTREGKQLKAWLAKSECDATLVLMEPAERCVFAVHTVWNANLVKSMANDINNHPLVKDNNVTVVVVEALQEMWKSYPTYVRYLALQEDGTWQEFSFLNEAWEKSSTMRAAMQICEREDQVELLRLRWIALQRELERNNADQAARAEAEAAFVMPEREEYARRRALGHVAQLREQWRIKPITDTTRPYAILERAEEAMQMQACEIILANVGMFHADRTIWLSGLRAKCDARYSMVSLDEVIAYLYQTWVTGFYTEEQPHAYKALKDLLNTVV